MKKHLIVLLLLLAFLSKGGPLLGQQQSASQKKEATELLSRAKVQMAQQDYKAANQSFRQMLALNTTLPTDMCYYFGSTLFMLGQYENSLGFIEKYLQLAGTGGEFHRQSQELKELLDEKLKAVRECSLCDTKGYVLEACLYCEEKGTTVSHCTRCYGRQQVQCQQCLGEGVVIEKTQFGKRSYHTCQLCQGKGIQTCPKCDGAGTLEQECAHCNGSGKLPTEKLCSHGAKIP